MQTKLTSYPPLHAYMCVCVCTRMCTHVILAKITLPNVKHIVLYSPSHFLNLSSSPSAPTQTFYEASGEWLKSSNAPRKPNSWSIKTKGAPVRGHGSSLHPGKQALTFRVLQTQEAVRENSSHTIAKRLIIAIQTSLLSTSIYSVCKIVFTRLQSGQTSW